MKKTILIALAIFSTVASAGKIYKWVDEKGVTHYGEQKPANIEAKQMNADKKPKQLSGDAKELADSFAQELLRDKGDAEQVNCKKAVFNAKDSIDTMLTVSKKNYKAGYIKEANYRKMTSDLKKAQKQISISECKTATGKVLGFYKCMTNDYNHVASCGKKYDYGS